MLTLISLAISIALGFAISITGFTIARRFVRERLRFVDAAHRASAPFLAGAGAALLALPIAALLPFIGAGTAIVFGISVGMGVSQGAKDVRRLT